MYWYTVDMRFSLATIQVHLIETVLGVQDTECPDQSQLVNQNWLANGRESRYLGIGVLPGNWSIWQIGRQTMGTTK